MSTEALRHLTVTGFLVHEGRVLVHWHKRTGLWLPMGGHIEPNEDPAQAVLREVEEESGVRAEIVPVGCQFEFTNIGRIPAPVTVLLAPIPRCSVSEGAGWTGPVEHIDLVYYCRPREGLEGLRTDDQSFRWLTVEEVKANRPAAPAEGMEPRAMPDDVRELALDAIHAASVPRDSNYSQET